MLSVFSGLALLMIAGLGPRAAVYAASVVTLYDVPPPSTSNTVSLVDHESIFLSVDGVGADGATTYVDVMVQSYQAEVLPSTTITIVDEPFTATATLVEDASGYRITSPDESCTNGNCTVDTAAPQGVRTCSFGTDGQGTCVQGQQAQVGGISTATTIQTTWSGSVVPVFTLPASTSAPKSNGAAASLVAHARTTSLVLGAALLVFCAV
ncbi:hypothetical protein B0H16DRAFT_1741533 [Mycena metata]|uniref:Uncharacterized protein n=1 Tax=Mycena metata TaxID=1033252 RepID=A0AAD7HA36_9AGAR|nr:hypothetical protein B0H16DRAFT_1741533 [Mycena metata]